MGDRDPGAMTSLERDLVWLGYEDYTGLWQVVFEVQANPETRSAHAVQAFAREVVESLLTRGWIDLYLTDGPLDNDKIARVPTAGRAAIIASEESWSLSGKAGKLVWFGTTDEGFAAYQEAIGWH